MNKSQMLSELINHFAGGNKSRFAAMLGVRPQTINTWITRCSFDSELIFAHCEGVSGDWLLSGEGPMLRQDANKTAPSQIESLVRQLYAELSKQQTSRYER